MKTPMCAMMTHTGLVRTTNEDVCGAYPVAGGGMLYVVCDGVGGCRGGEIAARVARDAFAAAVREMAEQFREPVGGIVIDERPLSVVKSGMRAAAACANRAVREAQVARRMPDMATTLVAALVTDARVYVLHVGDSRLYTVNRDSMERVTRDHSYLQYLLDIGRITAQEAAEFSGNNFITRAMGAQNFVDADFVALARAALSPDTYLLLCTDGLTGELDDETVHGLALAGGTLPDCVARLCRAVLSHGGKDNLTVMLAAL